MKHFKWYGYVYPKALDVMPLPKLFTPDLAPEAAFSFDPTGRVFFSGGVAGGYGILVTPPYRPEFVLALLNSRLLDFFHHHIATQMRGGWFSYEARFIKQLPIRTIDFSDRVGRAQHDKLVRLVEQMIAAKKEWTEAEEDYEKRRLDLFCTDLDREIDRLVYQLYELTDDEIAIVEAATPRAK